MSAQDEFLGLQFRSAVQYTIRDLLGQGGMGIVFLADRESEGFHDRVVLKTVPNLTPEREAALKQEAYIASGIRRHVNIVRTYGLESVPVTSLSTALQQRLTGDTWRIEGVASSRDAAESGEIPSLDGGPADSGDMLQTLVGGAGTSDARLYFIVLEYIDGLDLGELHTGHVRQGLLLPWQLGAYIVSRIARALERAHNDIVHRDVSPENVMIDRDGVPMLSDFGVSVDVGSGETGSAGKLRYIAPELLQGGRADERIDLYSLGVLAYLLASGIHLHNPPAQGAMLARAAAIVDAAEAGYPRLDQIVPDVPETYADIVARMLAADPDQRTARASVVASELEQNVLYVKGLGPSHHALASYIQIYESGFASYDDEQLAQLTFLRDEEGTVQLKRRIRRDTYTEAGWGLIEDRPDGEVARWMEGVTDTRLAPAGVTDSGERRAVLKIRFGDGCLESIPFTGTLDIGRSAGMSQVVVMDQMASRRHCRLTLHPEGKVAQLVDLASGNGTHVANERVDRAALHEGDAFRIGTTHISFLREPPLIVPTSVVERPGDRIAALLKLGDFAVQFPTSDRGSWMPTWTEMAHALGLPSKTGFVFATAITECCGLVADPEQQLTIRIALDRTRLRLWFFGEPEGTNVTMTLMICKKIAAGQEVKQTSRAIAFSLIRHVFDRIDVYRADGVVMLAKSL